MDQSMEDRRDSQDIVHLMASFRGGDPDAARQLVEIFYPELRRIAGSRMKGERQNHTLQATALVSELYVELVRIGRLRPGGTDSEEEKAHFLRLSAYMMRRILIHHARPLSKRVERVELGAWLTNAEPSADMMREVDRTLDNLSDIDPRLRQVVEMKVFEGLSVEEMALCLDCSVRTVMRHWSFAKRWLETELATFA